MMRFKKAGTRRPLRTEAWQARADSRARGGAAYTHMKAMPKPSELFDWDTALHLHAHTMKELGYPLSPQQREMIRNG